VARKELESPGMIVRCVCTVCPCPGSSAQPKARTITPLLEVLLSTALQIGLYLVSAMMKGDYAKQLLEFVSKKDEWALNESPVSFYRQET
jgi:hypothetical protein